MRSLSAATLAAIFAKYTGSGFFHLVSIAHSQLPATLYYCDNNQDVVSNGNTYKATQMEVSIPVEDSQTSTTAGIQIDNIALDISLAIETCSGVPPVVTISVINNAEPDTVVAGPFPMELRELEYDETHLNATLQYEEVLDETFPGDQMTPGTVPGIYQDPRFNPSSGALV